MKKIIFIISISINLLIVGIIFYVVFFTSTQAHFEDEKESQKIEKDFTLINKKNNVSLTEINKTEFRNEINKLSSKNKLIVVYWASWCQYCPSLIKAIENLKSNDNYKFKTIYISIDKPNDSGKNNLLKKVAKLNLKDSIYIVDELNITDFTNFKSIYSYLPEQNNFDKKPGLPHFLIYENNKVLYEDTGYDEIFGLSKFEKILQK